jgi:DNA-binding GntR family transcriptional regulator
MLLTAYIKEDLAARLKSGRPLPAQLTIDSLADYYQVSFTPVRTAVAELIAQGLLEKRPNRRLAVCARAEASADGGARLPEPPRDPYEVIVGDLVELSLKGEAVYLREEATAQKYAMSRSAMRNILHRLAGEGVLDHIPRRGWRLRPFRQDDLRAFTAVREVLELKALDLAALRLDPAELRRMLQANRLPRSANDFPQIDESLHDYLVATAGNAYIQDFLDRQGRYYRLLFRWEDHDRKTATETVRQHRAILTSLLEGDLVAARLALSHHIRNNHPILGRVIQKEPGSAE